MIAGFQGELKFLIWNHMWQQPKQQTKSELNVDIADVILERGPNGSGYTNMSILWGWIIILRGDDVINE